MHVTMYTLFNYIYTLSFTYKHVFFYAHIPLFAYIYIYILMHVGVFWLAFASHPILFLPFVRRFVLNSKEVT